MTKPQEKRTALDAFIEHKARIDAMLERLQAASADHFETNPEEIRCCLLYTSPSPRDRTRSRMPSSA